MHVQIDLNEGNHAELAGVCALLSRLWNEEANRQALQQLSHPGVAASWKRLGGEVPSATPEVVEELAVDYCQLLIGPQGHVSPVQSIWSTGRFEADAAHSMQQFIDMLKGFQPCNKIIDHVAVQLQYFGAVLGVAGQAPNDLWRGLATRFADSHLEWTGEFFEKAEQQSNTDFYRGLAMVSRRFLFE
ncbi:MAG: TorD/DmsD family molecular chaperone [Pirellulaceae bacterium]